MNCRKPRLWCQMFEYILSLSVNDVLIFSYLGAVEELLGIPCLQSAIHIGHTSRIYTSLHVLLRFMAF